MKRIICISFSLVFIISMSACGTRTDKLNSVIDDINNKFNFLNYENGEIYDIELISLKKCATYSFNYNSDNYKIKGYISIPAECIENEIPYKCILYNRGGNSKIGLLEDDDTAKICEQTSRIVIASQYRGADGSEGVDEFGGKDLNDVIKLVDLCDNTFEFVDMTDFCSIGVSRGGMMTYMTARKDSRIKKIIAVSAISNLIKEYNQRDDMEKVLSNRNFSVK